MPDDRFRAAARCEDCTILGRATVALPLLGKTISQAKLWSPLRNRSESIALDDSGIVADVDALLRSEGMLKIARQGKLRDDVYARSLTTSPDLVPIWIWADYREDHEPREGLISHPAFRASVDKNNLSRLRTVTSKITAWLDARGFATSERGTFSPVINADVPTAALSELGHIDGVAIVGLRDQEVLTGTTWFNAVKGSAAQAIIGSAAGQTFCTTEPLQPDNYNFLTVPSSQIYASSGGTSYHMRWTTELVAATAGTRMAPGATTHIANTSTGSAYSAWQWCVGSGIGAMNRSTRFNGYSYGGLTATDMAQDYYALRWPFPIITLAAGNCGDSCSVNCTTQTNKTVANRSYNVLVVGGSDDKGTNGTSDDAMAIFSPYGNPQTTHGDFELPNLVAPAVNIDSASLSPNLCGTSGASPQVLGAALLMKARDNSFSSWPEMTRASILATAAAGVDNGTRTTQLSAGGTDIRQGAGLFNAQRAVTLADPANYVAPNSSGVQLGRYAKSYSFATDFTNDTSNDAYYATPTFNGRLRVAMAWDATPSGCSSIDGGGCTGETLDADLDLLLYKWNGTSYSLVCQSSTYDSSWELCDVPVNAGEAYKIQFQKFSTPAMSTYVGIAWYTYDPAND